MFLGKHTFFLEMPLSPCLRSVHRECGRGWQPPISFNHFQVLWVVLGWKPLAALGSRFLTFVSLSVNRVARKKVPSWERSREALGYAVGFLIQGRFLIPLGVWKLQESLERAWLEHSSWLFRAKMGASSGKLFQFQYSLCLPSVGACFKLTWMYFELNSWICLCLCFQ